ncbi:MULTISPECIES: AbrB family transcriptional regulator [Rhodovulum]|uniref:Ammonia monooxygenase n=2 Tax=Rhodovulum TaxID=34008 RepID=A0A8E3APQ2_9RHOB|nr:MULTISPECIES: AbrB family transcriptional regulator [Rhodovulum]PTW46587.1 hypothetical protein C8N38_11171 [Rhodovulum kholense]RAP41105.1 ammonia monooxygenase [Rhodovulum viride]
MSLAGLSAPARGAVTLGIGALGGGLFFALDLPLPWVLGSLAATALAAQATRFQPVLPRPWRGYAMVGIGTMLGTGFTPEVVARAGTWWSSLLVMSALSLAVCLVAFGVFLRWGRMDRTTALFASMPGGLSVVSILVEDYPAEINRVALCHTARLLVLLVLTPVIIQLLSGTDLADANRAAFAHAEALDPLRHGALALAALASWAVARRINFPSALLLIPLFASAALHATGLLDVHVPAVLSCAAQIVIGAGVGGRFAAYTMREIARDGWLAALVGGFMALGALVAAVAFAPVAGADVSALFLAYLPGGAPELGVVALALMIDPAMVIAHHVLRVFLIVALLPAAANLTRRGRGGPGR